MIQFVVAVGLQEKTAIIETRNNTKHTAWPGVTANFYLDTHQHVTENISTNRVMMIIIVCKSTDSIWLASQPPPVSFLQNSLLNKQKERCVSQTVGS